MYSNVLGKKQLTKNFIHIINIKILKKTSNNLFIGVGTMFNITLNSDPCDIKSVWGWKMNKGKCENSTIEPYGIEVMDGDMITMIVDRINGSIRF